MSYFSKACVLAGVFTLLPSLVSAATISLLFERNVNSGAGTELFVQDYPSQTDLLANTNGTGSFSAIDIAGSFSLGGAFYDGSYNLLLERNLNSGAGTELFLQSYATMSDLLNNTNGTGSFSAIDIAGSFSLGGAFYDGSYNLLLERNINSGAGTELFLQSYATISDLLTNTNGTGSFSAIDLAGSFSLGGAYFDGAYNLLLERNLNSGAGTELFLQSYATISDLLNNTNGTGSFSAIDIAGSFSVGGAFFTPDPDRPPDVVPLPASGILLLGALALGIGFGRRKPATSH